MLCAEFLVSLDHRGFLPVYSELIGDKQPLLIVPSTRVNFTQGRRRVDPSPASYRPATSPLVRGPYLRPSDSTERATPVILTAGPALVRRTPILLRVSESAIRQTRVR
jgi:hypothetical protein